MSWAPNYKFTQRQQKTISVATICNCQLLEISTLSEAPLQRASSWRVQFTVGGHRPPLQGESRLIAHLVSFGFDFLHDTVEGVGDIVFVNGACFERLGSVEVEGDVRHIDAHAFFIVSGIDLPSHRHWGEGFE